MAEVEFKNAVNKFIKFHNQSTYTPYSRGTPDHWYSGKRDLWIEYKFVRSRPNTISWKALLEPLQYRWCKNRRDEGRMVWVMVGYRSNQWGLLLRHYRSHVRVDPIDRLLSAQSLANEIIRYCNE